MLTDDELTSELRAAFREQAASVTYNGRRCPRNRTAVALPAAVAAVALAAGLGVALHPAASVTRPLASASPSSAMVNKTISLAGFTIHFKERAGAPDPVRAVFSVRSLPPGAQPVPLTDSAAKAWVGTDPASGDNALYLQSPVRNGGQLFALVSPSLDKAQLIALVKG